MTGVINDPLGQPTVQAGSDFSLYFEVLWRMYGQPVWKIDQYRQRQWSASWINTLTFFKGELSAPPSGQFFDRLVFNCRCISWITEFHVENKKFLQFKFLRLVTFYYISLRLHFSYLPPMPNESHFFVENMRYVNVIKCRNLKVEISRNWNFSFLHETQFMNYFSIATFLDALPRQGLKQQHFCKRSNATVGRKQAQIGQAFTKCKQDTLVKL